MNEEFCVLIRISLKFVPNGPVDNRTVLVQVMVWRRTGALTMNSSLQSDAHMAHSARPSLVQIMVWRQTGAKPLSQPMETKF